MRGSRGSVRHDDRHRNGLGSQVWMSALWYVTAFTASIDRLPTHGSCIVELRLLSTTRGQQSLCGVLRRIIPGGWDQTPDKRIKTCDLLNCTSLHKTVLYHKNDSFFYCVIQHLKANLSLKYFNVAQLINISHRFNILYTLTKITKRFLEELLNHSNNFLELCILWISDMLSQNTV